MNLERTNRGSGAAVGFIAVGAVFAVIAVAVKLSLPMPAVDEDRGAERAKASAEVRAADDQSLNSAAILDAERGTVRLPIAVAMELAASKGKDAAAARADLKARAEKASAEAPKKPAKPSEFE